MLIIGGRDEARSFLEMFTHMFIRGKMGDIYLGAQRN